MTINADLGAVQTRTGIRFEVTATPEGFRELARFFERAADDPPGHIGEVEAVGRFGQDQIQVRMKRTKAGPR